MSDILQPESGAGDEDATPHLLRLAGPRQAVSGDRAARVRAIVHAEWQNRTRRRAMRRRVMVTSAILAAVSIVLMVDLFRRSDRSESLSDPVAVVERIDGNARLVRNETIRAGEWIETDASARVALRFSDGTSVRLDAGSRVRPLSSSLIELAAGAVYVDTERESGRFEVRTPLATARDVGTQFEVRLIDRTVRLRVRTGVVELSDRVRAVSGRAGTEITLSATGAVRRPIVAHGTEWDWTARVSPPLEMEGASMAAFLERVAREHGWVVRYADPALAGEASRIVLHGSVSGLAPHEMIDVAIATSGLDHRFDSGQLHVFRAARSRAAGDER